MDEQTLFFTALEQSDPLARAAWLDEACGGDQRLKERIQGLILRHEEARGLLEQPPTGRGATPNEHVPHQDWAASLDAGLATAFAPSGASLAASPAQSVLKIISRTIDLPRVVLREREADGKRLATGSLDETIKIWNLNDGRKDITLYGHLDDVYSVAWGRGDRWLAWAEDGRTPLGSVAEVWRREFTAEIVRPRRRLRRR